MRDDELKYTICMTIEQNGWMMMALSLSKRASERATCRASREFSVEEFLSRVEPRMR